jgi:hypothetical protein
MLKVPRTTAAIAQLEQLHTMITLDEAVEILTGKKPSLSNRVLKGAVSLWRDISLAVSAPFRKAIDVIDGQIMYPVEELELYLRRCRKISFIEQLGMEVPYYDFEDGEIRLISTDLIAALKGEPPLEFPDCIAELRKGGPQSEGRQSAGNP